MTNYILQIILRVKNWFGYNEGQTSAIKRSNSVFDNDDSDDSLSVPEIKRPRWHFESRSRTKMTTESNPLAGTSQGKVQKSRFLTNADVKENIDLTGDDDDDVEVISPIRTGPRPPLSPLSGRHGTQTSNPMKKEQPKSSSTPLDQNGSGTISRRHNLERTLSQHLGISKKRSSASTSSSRSNFFRNSALNESIRLDEKRTYSMLLQSLSGKDLATTVQKKSEPKSHIPGMNITFRKRRPLSIQVVDLTKGDDGHIPIMRPQELVATPFCKPKKVERVNSYEEKLKSYGFIGAQWIEDMQKKYQEKEREKRRSIEEAAILKDLYQKQNSKFQDALSERIQRHLQITEAVLVETEEDVSLPPLTPEMEEIVEKAFYPTPPGQVLVEGFGQKICRRDLQTLNNLNWLNDEVINFYMNLLIERGKNDNMPSIYAFNTFFYPKIISAGQSAVKRWTKKVDIFAVEMVIVPVHLGMHWCLSTIDFRDKTVRYYDSMGSSNNRCLNALLKYLEDESLDKKKQPFDTSGWKLENIKDIPQQMNGSDCGMFSCMFAEYLSRSAKISFSQEDMPYFRKKMTYEILTKQLLT